MLSEKRKWISRSLVADNNTLICFALLDALIILVLLSRFMPDAFMPGHLDSVENMVGVYTRVIVSVGIFNLLGLLAIFFGSKSLNDTRKSAHGKVNVKKWNYWLYLITLAFGVFAVFKSLVIFWLITTTK